MEGKVYKAILTISSKYFLLPPPPPPPVQNICTAASVSQLIVNSNPRVHFPANWEVCIY